MRPGGVEWNKRQHEALGILAVYLPDCVEAVKTVAPLLGHTFDVKGYSAATGSLIAQVNDLLEAMEEAHEAEEDGADDDDYDDGQD